MRIIPLTLKQLNSLITEMHRHHKPVVGHRFSLGLLLNGKIIGGCSVGRPVSRELDQYVIAEVTRLVTDGTKNACSMLYGAAARTCAAMGFDQIQTYILESEPAADGFWTELPQEEIGIAVAEKGAEKTSQCAKSSDG
jgi:hypothetical protein